MVGDLARRGGWGALVYTTLDSGTVSRSDSYSGQRLKDHRFTVDAFA